MSNTDAEWRKWARLDPYFAVVTHEKFKGGAAKDDFFALGEARVQEVLARLERSFGQLSCQRALEFGCGVGRLTLPLARRFSEVVGVDISSDMLAEAKSNCASSNLTNARFALSDDQLSQVEGKFDLVLSLITLQHISTERGMVVIENLLDRLTGSGAIYIDMPISHPRPSWARALGYRKRQFLHSIGMAAPPMQMNVYPFPDVIRLFQSYGIDLTLVSYANHGGILVVGVGGRRGLDTRSAAPS